MVRLLSHRSALVLAVVASAAAAFGFATLEGVARAPGEVRSVPQSRSLPGPYRAEILRVLDGDTFEARLVVWFGHEVTVRVRLRGADAPELRARCASVVRLAVDSKAALADILAQGEVILTDLSPDKFNGRVVASATVVHGAPVWRDDVSALMIAGGYAAPYSGGRRPDPCAPERIAGGP